MNIRKLFALLAGVSMVANVVLPGLANAATPDTELGQAYEWAKSKSITTMPTYEAANMYGNITRAELAKMLSNWAMNVKGNTPDESAVCEFSDIDSVKGDLHDFIIKSCQLGLMGQNMPENKFRPYDNISRAEFGTALSRALWGDENNGGTPYYAKHLNALKDAGIMTQISNAESMKEVRGYVMLMLMRSEGTSICDDVVVKVTCAAEAVDGTYKDCPTVCRDNEDNTDTVVKSGDLTVSANAADGRKALIGGTSDLDTLTFKTSEEVAISSITLERYGYSTIDDVVSVQLEDEDGNIIADAKELNSRGQVKLTIKKDYRKVDGTYKATVVVNTRTLPYTDTSDPDYDTYKDSKNGSTLGFKVVSAESSAKNLDLSDYDPYTYDLVNYDGSKVQFSDRNSDTKTYSWEAGEFYEIAKFRVKAPADATILVRGFTLADAQNNVIEADKFAKSVKVTVNGTEVEGLKWSFNKDDELVLSFDDVEVAGKETATFAVKMSLNEDFDNLGKSAQYKIESLTKFNATDKKTGTRVSQDSSYRVEDITWTVYTFKGGKVKISGTKLGTVNAAAGANNVLVAQGEISITEALRGTAEVVLKDAASYNKVEDMKLVINKVEYDGTKDSTNHKFIFKGLEIEKSGTVEVRMDIKDDTNGNIEFAGSINSASFNLKYDESGEPVDSTQIIGSLSVSTVKIQAATASLENNTTKDVEVIRNENNRRTIFEGTYTAKKGNVTLKNFVITTIEDALAVTPNPTFYVTLGNDEYDAQWNTTAKNARGDIDDIEVAAGKSITVKVEIEVTPTAAENSYNTFNIAFEGEDDDSNPAGRADDDTAKVKVVSQGSIDVDSSAKNTVLLKSNREVAVFTVKPSKSGEDDVLLNQLVFSAKKDGTAISNEEFGNLFKIDIDGDPYTGKTINPGIRIPAEGLLVKVTLKKETAAQIAFTLESVNTKTDVKTTFKKYFVPALLKITQRKTADKTYYSVDVEKDGSEVVKNVRLLNGTCANVAAATGATESTACKLIASSTQDEALSLHNTDLMDAINDTKAQSITYVYYMVGDTHILIDKSVYGDFFKKASGNEDLMVYSNGNN